jgi:hypothetical protein
VDGRIASTDWSHNWNASRTMEIILSREKSSLSLLVFVALIKTWNVLTGEVDDGLRLSSSSSEFSRV